ncbi:MAG: hypothetical protein K0R41_4596 [Geminicoccaceae bacterium]|nr:hypothetical protein [Geminicoccaceae bacterium]
MRAHLLGQELLDVDVEPAQRLLAAHQERGGDAQRVEDAGELDRDVAAADHHQPLRPLAQVLERLVRGDGVLDPRLLGQAGLATDRDQDAPGGMPLPADLDLVRAGHPAVGLEQLDPGLLQHPDVDAVQALDLAVARVDQGGPVQARRIEPPAVALRSLEMPREERAVAHQLLGDAAADHAGAADPARLAQGHPRAVGRGPPGAGDPARAAADHEQVEVRQDRPLALDPGRKRGRA